MQKQRVCELVISHTAAHLLILLPFGYITCFFSPEDKASPPYFFLQISTTVAPLTQNHRLGDQTLSWL